MFSPDFNTRDCLVRLFLTWEVWSMTWEVFAVQFGHILKHTSTDFGYFRSCIMHFLTKPNNRLFDQCYQQVKKRNAQKNFSIVHIFFFIYFAKSSKKLYLFFFLLCFSDISYSDTVIRYAVGIKTPLLVH